MFNPQHVPDLVQIDVFEERECCFGAVAAPKQYSR